MYNYVQLFQKRNRLGIVGIEDQGLTGVKALMRVLFQKLASIPKIGIFSLLFGKNVN